MRRGLLITVEGTDGSGKTTQIGMIKDYLTGKGFEVIFVREPGGTRISEEIRSLLLDPGNSEMNHTAEMLLYAAARAQLTAEVIKPAIDQGKAVICDRFVDSSYVYQGFGRGISLEVVEAVNAAALAGIKPDITFFFDISPEIALKRRLASTGLDRIEKEKMDFHMKVYNGYCKLVRRYPDRIKSIDSNRAVEEIFTDVKAWIDMLIKE
jgi:dTMP kinase